MKNKITLIVTFLTALFVLGSCLKDDVGEYWADEVAGKMYATVVKPTLQQLVLQPVAGDVNYEFLVNIATDALPTEDITVTFKLDPAAVTTYNTDYKKAFKAFPNVEILTKTLVIAKGTRNGYAKAKVWGADKLDACDNFIAAISIESAKTASGVDIPVAGNMKSYLLSLPISNPYAGDYNFVGYRIHPSLGIFTANEVETLTTIDCKTVRKDQMGDYPYIADIEITSATMVVNGATVYKVKVTTPDIATADFGMYETYTGSTTTAPAPPSADVNYYNPATKTFVLNYYYLSSGAARKIYEILVRK